MLDNLKKYRIVLASNSPRRKELLAGLDVDFSVRVIKGIDESYPDDLRGEDIVKYISKKKADQYKADMAEDELIITADTVVCLENRILGKPASVEEARTMLRLLSGCEHRVVTGVTLTTKEKQQTFAVTSAVRFAHLTDEEINYYVENYVPLDKAGAYGIQEWMGYVAVEELDGSFFNVMGLPVQRLYQELKKI